MTERPGGYHATAHLDADVPDILTPGALAGTARPAPAEADALALLDGVVAELEDMATEFYQAGPRLWKVAARVRRATETMRGIRG